MAASLWPYKCHEKLQRLKGGRWEDQHDWVLPRHVPAWWAQRGQLRLCEFPFGELWSGWRRWCARSPSPPALALLRLGQNHRPNLVPLGLIGPTERAELQLVGARLVLQLHELTLLVGAHGDLWRGDVGENPGRHALLVHDLDEPL